MKKGSKHSPEALLRMSKSLTGRVSPNKGKKFPEEWRKNLSKSHVGLKVNDVQLEALKKGREKGNAARFVEGQSGNPAYRSWQKNLWGKRKRLAPGTHTFGEWETLKAQYDWTCPACKKREPEIKLTEDHIIPLSRGGSDNIENIQPLCMPCNLRKTTRTVRY